MSEQLNKAFINGMGCGAKTFCQVIKDKIVKFDRDDNSELINDISQFVDLTLETSPSELQATLENIQNRISTMSSHWSSKE